MMSCCARRYGPLFVTCTQVLWLRALKRTSPVVLSVGMNANYVVTVLWGIVLLRQLPSQRQVAGGTPILLSIISGIAETLYSNAQKRIEEEGGLPFPPASPQPRKEQKQVQEAKFIRISVALSEGEHEGLRKQDEQGVGAEEEEEGWAWQNTLVKKRTSSHLEDDNLLAGGSPHYVG
jgi:hypothetical protein